jgi:hypothetical protein
VARQITQTLRCDRCRKEHIAEVHGTNLNHAPRPASWIEIVIPFRKSGYTLLCDDCQRQLVEWVGA